MPCDGTERALPIFRQRAMAALWEERLFAGRVPGGGKFTGASPKGLPTAGPICAAFCPSPKRFDIVQLDGLGSSCPFLSSDPGAADPRSRLTRSDGRLDRFNLGIPFRAYDEKLSLT